jgi:hypothetical protein
MTPSALSTDSSDELDVERGVIIEGQLADDGVVVRESWFLGLS